MFVLFNFKFKKLFIFNKAIFFILLILPFLFFEAKAAGAQEARGYIYDRINVSIKVNADSTFDVIEEQTFDYTGSYHEAWRSILLNKVDAITDIEVVDGENNMPLVYSKGELNKMRPENWGKFTYNKKNGKQNIIWYYNIADAKHKWIIKYKVHGGLEFGKKEDRLYWNIFTDYDVPVKESSVNVAFPKGVAVNSARVFSYRNKDIPIKQEFIHNNSIFYKSSNFDPKEAFTIDIGWSKGIIAHSAYWKDFFRIYYGYVFSLLSVIVCLLIGFFYWLKNEKMKKGRGTIIAEYQPPRNLRPAMAEIIIKEKITAKGLTATIVDLAIRGYVRIEEDKSGNQVIKNWALNADKFYKIFNYAILLFFLIYLIINLFSHKENIIDKLFILIPLLFVVFVLKAIISRKDYLVIQNKPFGDDPNLEDYEKEYLGLLMANGRFSTKELRLAGPQTKKDFFEATKELKKTICEETESDTKAFEVGPSKEIIFDKIISSVFVAIAVGLYLFSGVINLGSISQSVILFLFLLLSGGGLWLFIKYEARLNREGRILKEEWQGFKLYLETAERYRMQNLTPDIFEKYLPYAMIFGVEKKWARAFESVNMAAPSWYGGSSGYTGSGSSSSFSPAVFSSSFSSSFSSAFASSGAGGGGAGGGGAGGGGGGGGGGAS